MILFAILIWCVACVPTEEAQEGIARVQESPTPLPTAFPTEAPHPLVDMVIEGLQDGKTKEELANELAEMDMMITYWSEFDDETWAVGLTRSIHGSPSFSFIVDGAGILYHHLSSLRSIETIDFDEDNKSEFLLHHYHCGAHTCFNTYKVIQKQLNGQYEQLSPAMSQASSGELMITTFEGQKTFALHGGRIGSAGAGQFQREQTIYWGLNPETNRFEQVGIVEDEPIYRLHALHDANYLFGNSEYEPAKSLYEKVVSDVNEYEDTGSENVDDHTQQFAAFRLVLVNLMLEDEGEAQEWSRWLTKKYASSMAADATPLLIESDDNLAVKCQAVTGYLEQQEEVRGEKAAGRLADIGYAVQSLPYQTFCPIRE